MKIKGEYFTINELAEITGKTYNAMKQLLYREGIKPVINEVLYDKSALEVIRNVPGKGRPRKPKASK